MATHRKKHNRSIIQLTIDRKREHTSSRFVFHVEKVVVAAAFFLAPPRLAVDELVDAAAGMLTVPNNAFATRYTDGGDCPAGTLATSRFTKRSRSRAQSRSYCARHLISCSYENASSRGSPFANRCARVVVGCNQQSRQRNENATTSQHKLSTNESKNAVSSYDKLMCLRQC